MDVVELGGIRLHLLAVHPGVAYEADRTIQMLGRLAPAVILGDVDTGDALQIRRAIGEKRPYEPGFVDALFESESRARFARDARAVEHPLQAAARYARDRGAEFVPLRPMGARPGLLRRHRVKRAVANIEAKEPAAFADAFAHVLAERHAWDPASEIEAAHKRLLRALMDGRAPVVAVIQAHRRALYEDAVLATGRIPA